MKLLITGGAGFVGANLLSHLNISTNFDVVVLDNEILGKQSHIADLKCEFVNGDVRDTELLNNLTKGIDVIVHLAADTRVIPSIENPVFNFHENVTASFGLLEAARANNVGQVVAASTGGAIIGEAVPPVHEEMVANPISPYGASKLCLEAYCSAYAGSYGMNTMCARFSNLYGPRSFHKGSVVAQFLRNIHNNEPLTVYGDGSQVRDYLFTGDLTKGLLSAIQKKATGVYQFGSGKGVSLNDLIAVILQVTDNADYPVNYVDSRSGEIHTTWCDVSKAGREFGFEANTNLETGIKSTWEWFKKRV